MIRLLGRTSSSNVQKVMWCIGELGIAVDHDTQYGGKFGNTKTPEYLVMNPNGLVPTIIDGDFVLWESHTIVRYLASEYGKGGLYPTDSKARANAEKWMDWGQTCLDQALFPAFYQLVRTPPEQRDQALIDQSVSNIARPLEILDTALAGHQFVSGEQLTIADVALGPAVHRILNMDIDRPVIANVEAWYQRLQTRAVFAKVFALPLL